MVDRALICPPGSQIGPISPEQRQQIMRNSVVSGVYDKTVDRESAYERLKNRAQSEPAPTPSAPQSTSQSGSWFPNLNIPGLGGSTGGGRRGGDSLVEAMAKSAARSIGSSVGRQIVRGVLGSLLGGSRR
jgi:hypothetical protein